ncbi:MAG: hypothetical protein ACJAYX_003015 [Planctomycetota bacterium]|jgi:hypothetical protein
MTKEKLAVSVEFADRWRDSKSVTSLSTRTQAVMPRGGSCVAVRRVASHITTDMRRLTTTLVQPVDDLRRGIESPILPNICR